MPDLKGHAQQIGMARLAGLEPATQELGNFQEEGS